MNSEFKEKAWGNKRTQIEVSDKTLWLDLCVIYFLSFIFYFLSFIFYLLFLFLFFIFSFFAIFLLDCVLSFCLRVLLYFYSTVLDMPHFLVCCLVGCLTNILILSIYSNYGPSDPRALFLCSVRVCVYASLVRILTRVSHFPDNKWYVLRLRPFFLLSRHHYLIVFFSLCFLFFSV